MCAAWVEPALSSAECRTGPVHKTSGLLDFEIGMFSGFHSFTRLIILSTHPCLFPTLLTHLFVSRSQPSVVQMVFTVGFCRNSAVIPRTSTLIPDCKPRASSKKKSEPIFLAWKCLFVRVVNASESVVVWSTFQSKAWMDLIEFLSLEMESAFCQGA